MKYKIIAGMALLGLLAASCNKTATQQSNNTGERANKKSTAENSRAYTGTFEAGLEGCVNLNASDGNKYVVVAETAELKSLLDSTFRAGGRVVLKAHPLEIGKSDISICGKENVISLEEIITAPPQSGNNTPGNNGSAQNAPQPDHFSPPTEADVAPMPEVFEVQITPNGFSPATITIKQGDYVQFVNKDSSAHRPASNPHPVHTALPGFDAGKGLAQGEKYRFQFTKTGEWEYHDHFNPSSGGKVIVQ